MTVVASHVSRVKGEALIDDARGRGVCCDSVKWNKTYVKCPVSYTCRLLVVSGLHPLHAPMHTHTGQCVCMYVCKFRNLLLTPTSKYLLNLFSVVKIPKLCSNSILNVFNNNLCGMQQIRVARAFT